LTFVAQFFMVYDCATSGMKDCAMTHRTLLLTTLVACFALSCSAASNFLKGGIHKDLDEDLTIVKLTENPSKYLNKEIVISVRFYKKGDLPCPLGEDFVNFIVMDRVSYITLNKAWIKKDKAGILDKLKETETVVMKARVFAVDREKDPNLEALEIVPE
jgi:hypothetical protein